MKKVNFINNCLIKVSSFLIISLFMFFIFVSSLSLKINANNKIINNKGEEVEIIGSYENNKAIYAVKESVEDRVLEFGLKYRYDKAYVNTTDPNEITGDMNAAGGGAYAASGKMMANTYYPTDVRLFEISPDLGLEVIPWAKFKNGNWSLATVLAMAEDYEASHPGKKVIGAINGDFFDISAGGNYPYTSTGSTVVQGNYMRVNEGWNSIGFKDGTLKGNITGSISEKPKLDIFDENDNVIFSIDIDNINIEPKDGETSCFIAFWDQNHEAVNINVSNVYVVNAEKLVAIDQRSIYGIGEVSSDTSASLGKKNFAIKTNNNEVKEKIKQGVKIRVQFVLEGELGEYDSVIGYPHTVMLEGENVAPLEYRHPRTAIGVKADGTIVMAEIDGRQTNINCYGCTLNEEAALMKYYGCVEAFNLDGGGSSTICLIQDGKLTIQNSPSDGNPRSDGNCLLIVASVPTLEIKCENVTTESFDIKVNISNIDDKYKDLYIYSSAKEEYIKVIDGKNITYNNLDKNTKYNYRLYSKINDEYCMLPYSGYIFSAKDKYTISNIELKLLEENDKLYYDISYNIIDEYDTLLTQNFVINGKRFMTTKQRFKIETSYLSPLCSLSHLELAYNVNDLNGTVIDYLVASCKIEDSELVFDGVIDECVCMISGLFN